MGKSTLQRRDYYNQGRPGEFYGIWNDITKRFVFGIREKTPRDAVNRLFKKTGKDAYCYRYQFRRIPDDWVNPPNPRKYR